MVKSAMRSQVGPQVLVYGGIAASINRWLLVVSLWLAFTTGVKRSEASCISIDSALSISAFL